SEINSDLTYFAFTITILATAIVGGVGPGLLATALAGFTSAFLFLPPIYSIHVASQQEAARMILFIAEGVLVSLLGDQVHDSAALDNAGSVFRPYLNATMFVAGVTILKLFTWQKVELHMPFALYYLAVAASAWAGGFAPGITATLLASLCARFFFLEPRYFGSQRDDDQSPKSWNPTSRGDAASSEPAVERNCGYTSPARNFQGHYLGVGFSFRFRTARKGHPFDLDFANQF